MIWILQLDMKWVRAFCFGILMEFYWDMIMVLVNGMWISTHEIQHDVTELRALIAGWVPENRGLNHQVVAIWIGNRF